MLPFCDSAGAQWPKHLVVAMSAEIFVFRCWLRSDGVQFTGQFLAVVIERKVVDVVAEGVFKLVADDSKADYNVCSRW